MHSLSIVLALSAALVSAQPTRRAVASLQQAAFEEAQQRDAGATRAFSNVQIRTADGACLFVDKLSGDFRANLTPVQVASCGSTDGQGWDIITAGKHNDQKGQMLIVNTLTQACMNFDPRRKAGDQLNLFSCGGRADGGGQVTGSQLFKFDEGKGNGAQPLVPQNGEGRCLSSKGQRVDAEQCAAGAKDQTFTFGGKAAAAGNNTEANPPANNAGDANGGNANGGGSAGGVANDGSDLCDGLTRRASRTA